jgi:hypothetical protein
VQSWLSFQDCIKLHKLTIFATYFYMPQMIKKPQRVTVRQCMSCMGVLNEYLAYLPMVYDLSMAVEGTKKSNVLFDEADLARIVLNSVPVIWVSQYNMMHSTLPKFPHVLLPDLEAIKHIINKKHQASLKAKAKDTSSTSTSTKGSSKKCSASGNPSERVLKKARPVKFYQHCKSKGGPHLTHNTNKCCRYNKDGNLVVAPQVSPMKQRSPSRKGVISRWLI